MDWTTKLINFKGMTTKRYNALKYFGNPLKLTNNDRLKSSLK